MRDWEGYTVLHSIRNSQGNSPRECALLVVMLPSQDEYGQSQTRCVVIGKVPHLPHRARFVGHHVPVAAASQTNIQPRPERVPGELGPDDLRFQLVPEGNPGDGVGVVG